jgi:hypothetical protein
MLLWSSESMLTIDGFNDAIVVRPDLTPAFDKANRLFDLSSIISICSGLVLLIRIDDIDLLSLSFAHSSVRDFLLSPEVPSPFKSQLEERVARVTILRTCFAYLTCLDWEFDDVVEFTREHQFAVCSNDIWPRQARALEATDDEALALIIGFLESDLHNSTPFFRFTYPRIAPSGQEWCALYVAATEGLVRSCRHLIQHGRALVKSLLEDSALELGLYFKNTGRLVGVDIDRIIKDLLIGSRLDNALVTASLNGHDDIVRDLPIQFCCSMGYESLVHTLVSFNAAIDAPCPKVCALDRAANKGHLSIVTYLLDHGADPNFDNEFGTLLQDAAYTGDVAMVTVLLDHGAVIDHSCRETCPGRGICALLQAVAMDHEDIVELLLSRGASLEVAIDDAVRMGDEVIMEKMLALRPVFRRYERSRP